MVLTQEMPSAEQFADLRVRHNDATWVLSSDPADRTGYFEALSAGASAILPPSADLAEIIATIRMVAAGWWSSRKQVLAALPGRSKILKGHRRKLRAITGDYRSAK